MRRTFIGFYSPFQYFRNITVRYFISKLVSLYVLYVRYRCYRSDILHKMSFLFLRPQYVYRTYVLALYRYQYHKEIINILIRGNLFIFWINPPVMYGTYLKRNVRKFKLYRNFSSIISIIHNDTGKYGTLSTVQFSMI